MFSERAEGKRWVPRAKYIQETRGCQTENTSDAVPTPQPPCVLHAQTDRPLTSPVLSGLTCEVGGRCHARGWGHVGGGTWVWLVCPPWPPSLRPSVDGLSSWGPEGACGKMLLSIPGCEPCPPSAQRWLLQMPGGEGLPGMHGLGTEAVPSRAPGSGWSRSETVVTVQASENHLLVLEGLLRRCGSAGAHHRDERTGSSCLGRLVLPECLLCARWL